MADEFLLKVLKEAYAPLKQLPRIATCDLKENNVYRFSNFKEVHTTHGKALVCEINERFSYFPSKKVNDTFRKLLKLASEEIQQTKQFELIVYMKFIGMAKDSAKRPYGQFEIMDNGDEFYRQLCHEEYNAFDFELLEKDDFTLNEAACTKRKVNEQEEDEDANSATCSKYLKK